MISLIQFMRTVFAACLIVALVFCVACSDDEDDSVSSDQAGEDPWEEDPGDNDDTRGNDDDFPGDEPGDDDMGDDDDCTPRFPNVKVTAHRGVFMMAPENTIPTIEYAFEKGADMVEVDVRHTADGEYVLMHDDTVDRTTNGSGLVSEMTLAEIKALEVSSILDFEGLRVPTLEEALLVIDSYGGQVDLDMKSDEPEGAIELVVAMGLEEICFVHSSSATKLDRVRTVSMDVRIQPSCDTLECTQALLDHFDPDPEHIEISGESGFTPENISLIKSAGATVFMDALGARDVLAGFGHKQAWGAMMEEGVEIIQTDLPALLVEYRDSLCE